jgi:hypothetical protein
MVVPDLPRACMPILRDSSNHTPISSRNGSQETSNSTHLFIDVSILPHRHFRCPTGKTLGDGWPDFGSRLASSCPFNV